MPIELPPLRERSEDIPLLVEHFIDKFNALHGRAAHRQRDPRHPRGRAQSLRLHLARQHPRARERDRARLRSRKRAATSPWLPTRKAPPQYGAATGRSAASCHPAASTVAIDFHDQKEKFERDFIVDALRRFGGRINQTVQHAGIPKNTLLRKIRKYSINPGDYGPVDQDGEGKSAEYHAQR